MAMHFYFSNVKLKSCNRSLTPGWDESIVGLCPSIQLPVHLGGENTTQ